MITVDEATAIILKETLPWGMEEVPFDWALNRVLAEDLLADRDFPPFNRVSMDGIAIQYAAFAEGRRTFPVQGVAASGAPQMLLEDANHCIEVMTGAVLPEHTDTVIPYEQLVIEKGVATVKLDDIKEGKNVHPQGFDRKKGNLLVAKGKIISPAEIGVAATIGKATLRVLSPPVTMVISTGDELVEVNHVPLPHQIRRSNVYRIGSMLRSWGLDPEFQHLPDQRDIMVDQLANMLEQYQLIVLSGGISKGKFDYLPGVLEELGVQRSFDRVQQRPGKPFWFGKAPNGSILFALPGNPVSSFMCTLRYVLPWLEQCVGRDFYSNRPHARLTEAVSFQPNLTNFLQVKLTNQPDGSLGAKPLAGHGPGDLANLIDADAFLELPADREHFQAGEAFPVLPYRHLL